MDPIEEMEGYNLTDTIWMDGYNFMDKSIKTVFQSVSVSCIQSVYWIFCILDTI